MAKTDYRKSENRTIRLTVLGATENLPTAVSGYGKDCVGGDGYYAYVAAPQRAKALLIHEVPGPDGRAFHAWKATSTRDNPPSLVSLDKLKKISADQAQRAINAMQKIGAKPVGSGTVAQSVLRGRWKGYIECHPAGPRVVLTRDVAQYTSLALVSVPGKGWDYAIHVKDLASTRWFTAGSGKKVTHKGGIKSKSLTGKTKPTLRKAFNAAIQDLFGLVAQACSIRDTHRPGALSAKKKAAQNASNKARAEKAGRKPKAGTSPMTSSEVAAYKKARAKLKKNAAGTVGRHVQSAIDKASKAKAPKPVPASIAALKGTYRKITKGENEGHKGTVLSVKRDGKGYLLAFRKSGKTIRVQKTSTRAAKKPEPGKSKGKTEARVRQKPTASQNKLGKRFALLNANAGSLGGRPVYIKSSGKNAKETWDPRHGGAKLTVLLVGKNGISERTINEYRTPKGGKPESVLKLSGGKSVFNKAVKALAYDKDGKYTDKSLVRMADALSANGVLGSAGIKLGSRDAGRVKKARAALKGKAPAKPRKPKPQVAGPAKARKPTAGPSDAELAAILAEDEPSIDVEALLADGGDDEYASLFD
jgi:hypothetical protein